MEKSAGSRYEGFKSQIDMQMQSAFTSYFSKFMGVSPDAELIRILVGEIRGDQEFDAAEHIVLGAEIVNKGAGR